MRYRKDGARIARALIAAIVLTAAPPVATRLGAGPLKVRTLSAGLGYEYLARTVTWGEDPDASRFQASLISARAEIGFAKGIVLSLSAGLALTDLSSATFNNLPISLRYDGAPLSGFEISGTGRFVYSFGMKRTWPLEGFAVEGQAEGSADWMEAAIGPRVAYLGFDKIRPFLEISCRWLHTGFAMTETLDDLTGRETKRASKLSAGVALGAEAELSGRISFEARAGFVSRAGGVDGLAVAGLRYKF